MTCKFQTSRRMTSRGFTIVELLIVIIVIAILASITIVAYNGIQKRTVQSLVQNTAREAAKAMEMKKTVEGIYPTTIPDTFTITSSLGVGITQVGDQASFCFNVTTTRYDDVFYSIDQTGSVKQELCPGAVLETKGDYNANAGGGGGSSWLTASTVGKSVAPGDMEFTAETNDTWTQITFTWNAMPGATQYRLNTRSSSSATWYARSISSGAGSYPWDSTSSTAYSSMIPSSTTSITWASNIPTAFDESYEYRMQYKNAEGVWGDLQTLTLSPSDGRTIPKPTNFKVTPNADWSQLTVSWDGIGDFAKLPGVRFRVNQRMSSSATWYARSISTGSGSYAFDSTASTAYSSMTPPTTTSLNWTLIPPDGTTLYEYRIQIFSGSMAGEWTTFILDPLSGVTLPVPTNFKVVPSPDWSQATLSWDGIGSVASIPGVRFRLNSLNTPGGTWYARSITSGSGSYAFDSTLSSGYSSMTPPTTTSMTWTASIPSSVGSTNQYRIQTYTGTANSDWATFTLSR